MKLFSLEADLFKLDGGAMFGVVPKTIWQRTNPSDSQNRIDISATSLLIELGNRLILIDTGMGDKQSEKFYQHFDRVGGSNLVKAIRAHGFSEQEVTDVFLTHLHFDHVGGATIRDQQNRILPTFINATYWSNQEHWDWAVVHPNPREKASFLEENLIPLKKSSQLRFIDQTSENYTKCSQLPFSIIFANGHTEKQMLPMIEYQGKTLVFMADLLPTIGHIPLPYIMSYDTRPLITLAEKEVFLKKAAQNNWYLFLQHDARNQIITVKETEKGVRLDKTFIFNDLFNH